MVSYKMKLLQGKNAIITGGAQGIGKAIAKEFASHGANLMLIDMNHNQLSDTVKELSQYGVEIASFTGDVSKYTDIQNMLDFFLQKWDNIDILVNNAGITRDATLENMTESMWDQVISINLKSIFYTCKAVLPIMKQRAIQDHITMDTYGKIINISSNSADGNFGQTNYAASKAGVIGFTKTIMKEYGKYHIQTNAIKPGFIQTQMTDTIPEKIRNMTLLLTPLGRLGTPEDVARTALFLSSNLSNFITGQVIRVDGGLKS